LVEHGSDKATMAPINANIATIEWCAAPTPLNAPESTGRDANQRQRHADESQHGVVHSRDDPDSCEDDFGQKKRSYSWPMRWTPASASSFSASTTLL
jgi:hypothetical protein